MVVLAHHHARHLQTHLSPCPHAPHVRSTIFDLTVDEARALEQGYRARHYNTEVLSKTNVDVLASLAAKIDHAMLSLAPAETADTPESAQAGSDNTTVAVSAAAAAKQGGGDDDGGGEAVAAERTTAARASITREKGFFVRLGSRSPKDAVTFSRADLDAETASLAARELVDVDADVTSDDTESRHRTMANIRMRAFCELSIRGMRVDSGAAAVELFLSSERVFRDVVEALAAQRTCGFTQKVVVREWCAELDQEQEFRGFVCDGRLTALSQ
jgi:hypothetical protein